MKYIWFSMKCKNNKNVYWWMVLYYLVHKFKIIITIKCCILLIITQAVPLLRLDRLWIFSSSPSSKISFYTLDNLSSYFWVICRYTHCKTDDHTSKRPPFISYCMHCNWPKLLVFRLGSCSTRFRNLYFKYCLRTICHNLRVNL